MTPLRLVVVLALLLSAGCEPVAWRIKAFPVKSNQVPRLDQTVVLELPPCGTVVQARLGDGTPLWVSRELDDTVTVISAIDPHSLETRRISLVEWSPTVRRFNGSFIWDERGRVVGNSGWDSCVWDCPPESSLPNWAPNLDTFQFVRLEGEPERIRVIQRVSGGWRGIPRKPLPSWSKEPWERINQISLQEALRQPEGTVVRVDADVVLVSGEVPQVCKRGEYNERECCPKGSPRLYDVDGAPMDKEGPGVDSYGPGLLRRYRDGFVQYILGAPLVGAHATGYMRIPKPRGWETWNFNAPPPRAPCDPGFSSLDE
ncbi:hypothetical protein [Hyalangium gracile]|uniref:hypothetical protein n=1 Tax=Hyalangium gracile TaxID=394092 RepID=UPI001CCB5688|nr:hypothetical protein [Hyalangium gracile]